MLWYQKIQDILTITASLKYPFILCNFDAIFFVPSEVSTIELLDNLPKLVF